jgi:hypothetical protein
MLSLPSNCAEETDTSIDDYNTKVESTHWFSVVSAGLILNAEYTVVYKYNSACYAHRMAITQDTSHKIQGMASTQETPLIRFEKTCLKRGDARRSP